MSGGAKHRVAVLGLYNSGSTLIAGVLHRLGANMGAPFFASSDDSADNNYYEPRDLSSKLRRFWSEPSLEATVHATARASYLSAWAAQQESIRAGKACAKHPLLSLCAEDLVAAWGAETRFVWAYRPLEDSTAGLVRRGWFRGHERRAQTILWEALHTFEARHGGVTRIALDDVLAAPEANVARIADIAGLPLEDARLEAARAFIRA